MPASENSLGISTALKHPIVCGSRSTAHHAWGITAMSFARFGRLLAETSSHQTCTEPERSDRARSQKNTSGAYIEDRTSKHRPFPHIEPTRFTQRILRPRRKRTGNKRRAKRKKAMRGERAMRVVWRVDARERKQRKSRAQGASRRFDETRRLRGWTKPPLEMSADRACERRILPLMRWAVVGCRRALALRRTGLDSVRLAVATLGYRIAVFRRCGSNARGRLVQGVGGSFRQLLRCHSDGPFRIHAWHRGGSTLGREADAAYGKAAPHVREPRAFARLVRACHTSRVCSGDAAERARSLGREPQCCILPTPGRIPVAHHRTLPGDGGDLATLVGRARRETSSTLIRWSSLRYQYLGCGSRGRFDGILWRCQLGSPRLFAARCGFQLGRRGDRSDCRLASASRHPSERRSRRAAAQFTPADDPRRRERGTPIGTQRATAGTAGDLRFGILSACGRGVLGEDFDVRVRARHLRLRNAVGVCAVRVGNGWGLLRCVITAAAAGRRGVGHGVHRTEFARLLLRCECLADPFWQRPFRAWGSLRSGFSPVRRSASRARLHARAPPVTVLSERRRLPRMHRASRRQERWIDGSRYG